MNLEIKTTSIIKEAQMNNRIYISGHFNHFETTSFFQVLFALVMEKGQQIKKTPFTIGI